MQKQTFVIVGAALFIHFLSASNSWADRTFTSEEEAVKIFNDRENQTIETRREALRYLAKNHTAEVRQTTWSNSGSVPMWTFTHNSAVQSSNVSFVTGWETVTKNSSLLGDALLNETDPEIIQIAWDTLKAHGTDDCKAYLPLGIGVKNATIQREAFPHARETLEFMGNIQAEHSEGMGTEYWSKFTGPGLVEGYFLKPWIFAVFKGVQSSDSEISTACRKAILNPKTIYDFLLRENITTIVQSVLDLPEDLRTQLEPKFREFALAQKPFGLSVPGYDWHSTRPNVNQVMIEVYGDRTPDVLEWQADLLSGYLGFEITHHVAKTFEILHIRADDYLKALLIDYGFGHTYRRESTLRELEKWKNELGEAAFFEKLNSFVNLEYPHQWSVAKLHSGIAEYCANHGIFPTFVLKLIQSPPADFRTHYIDNRYESGGRDRFTRLQLTAKNYCEGALTE